MYNLGGLLRSLYLLVSRTRLLKPDPGSWFAADRILGVGRYTACSAHATQRLERDLDSHYLSRILVLHESSRRSWHV
jgi:hypothetical protein